MAHAAPLSGCSRDRAERGVWPFADALKALDEILFRRERPEEGIILLSPVEIEGGRGVQMALCAETVAAVRKLSDRALKILSGRDPSASSPL